MQKKRGELTMEHVNCQLIHAPEEKCRWLHLRDINQKIRFTERNQGPSNINAAASPDIKKVAAIQAVIDQSKYGTLQRVGNSYWDACKSFADTILSGNTGGLSEQELMDVLVDGITASTVK